MSRYVIAIILPPEVSSYHQRLVQEVGQNFVLKITNVPSHITLKDSFYTSDPREVETVIQQIIAKSQVQSPQVDINGIGNFDNKVYFMHAELNPTALQLHSQLITNLHKLTWLQWDQFDVIQRNFHVTITTKATTENSAAIAKLLAAYSPKFSFKMDNISIMRKLEAEHRWVIHKSFSV